MIRNCLFLICISISASAQIGAKVQQQSKIYGLWQNSQFGYQMTLMLNADGSGEFDGAAIKHSTQGNKLSIVSGGITTQYTFALQANSLTLSGGDLDGQVSFTRNGTGTTSTTSVSGVPADPTSLSNAETDSKLFGTWTGNGEMIQFKPEGQCVYLGNAFPFKTSQGNVILTTAQGNVMMGYAVKGPQLTLTVNGSKFVYNKAQGAGVGMGATTQTNANSNARGGVAMELVGKWCYMNMNTNSQSERCVVLNADGTYLYHTESSRSVNTATLSGGTASQGDDRGTWYVQGDRLFYQSQTQGQGSFKLEKRNHPKNTGDPMIVLDGEFFVTATLRDPWR